MTDQALNYFNASGPTADRMAFTPNPATPASGPDQGYVWFDTDDNTLYAWDGAAWSAPAGTGTVTSVATDASLVGGPIVNSGTLAVAIPPPPGGRLTLTSATPVITSTVTAATTVYYALYTSQFVPIYDGTNYVATVFAELAQATTDSTKSPAACTTNSNYDLFVWNDGGTIRCTRGPLWTSATARGTGAGTTELERVKGIWLNKVAITNGPGANRGTYVGTIRTNGSSQVDDYVGATIAAGGTAGFVIGVWNAYNQVRRIAENDDSSNYAYTSATWRKKDNSSNNRISWVRGLNESPVYLVATNTSYNTADQQRYTNIAIDSETSLTTGGSASLGGSNNNARLTYVSLYRDLPGLGFHYGITLEASEAIGTTNWLGNNGAAGEKWSSFSIEIWC